jgi:hypothetical protein
MLTYYAIEVIVKDRLREHRKELMIRAALREAYGDQSKRVSFYRRQWCRLRRFLAGFWLPREISFMRLELPPSLDLCAGTI